MKWVDQIETPIQTLVDDKIKASIEEKTKNIKIKWHLNVFSNFYIVIPFAIISGPLVFLLLLQMDTQFDYEANMEYMTLPSLDILWFSLIFAGIAVIFWYFVAKMVEKNKVRSIKKQLSFNEFYYIMSEKIPNIEILGHREEPINSITNAPSEFMSPVPGSNKMALKGSYSVRGKVNAHEFELTTTRWIAWNIRESVPSHATWSKLGIFGYEGTYFSSISIKDEKFKDFNFIISTYLGKNNVNKTQVSNDDFHKSFEIFGDAVDLHKLLNASEQDKYIKLRKNFEDFQVAVKDSVLTITFKTPKGFNDPNYKKAKTKVDPELVINSIDTTFIRLLDALSFVTCLRKVWE